MYEVNRSVFLLIPQEPFWLWLQNLPSLSLEGISLAALQQDANAYLITPADTLDDIRTNIEKQYQSIFTAELADWCDDEDLWPHIDQQTFTQWFSIRISSIVTDLSQEDLMRETFSTLNLN